MIAVIIIYAVFTLRVVAAPLIQNYSRLSYPFTALAGEMRDTGFSGGLIISNNRFLAGNMHFQFPNSRALIPDYNFEQLPYPPAFTRAAVIWKADAVPKIPVQLATFLKNSYNIDWADYPVNYYEHPYKYNSSDTVKLGVLQFQLPKRDH
jgi:hypothetical protein